MTAIAPVITAVYAGVLGLIGVFLGLRVSLRRGSTKTFTGSGDDDVLARRVRAHGNFAEWVPLTLILLALIEMIGAPSLAIHVFGVAIVVGRVLHSLGLLAAGGSFQVGRAIGGLVAYIGVALIALYAIWLAFAGPIIITPA